MVRTTDGMKPLHIPNICSLQTGRRGKDVPHPDEELMWRNADRLRCEERSRKIVAHRMNLIGSRPDPKHRFVLALTPAGREESLAELRPSRNRIRGYHSWLSRPQHRWRRRNSRWRHQPLSDRGSFIRRLLAFQQLCATALGSRRRRICEATGGDRMKRTTATHDEECVQVALHG